MAEIIAVYGSPGSGKTTVAIKTAIEIYLMTKDDSVIFLSPDIVVPSVALLFPNYTPDEICSLGNIFDNTQINAETILKNTVTVKTMKNFGCLGFKAGDNRYSYPVPTEEKINTLFDTLSSVAGFVIVDCTSEFTDDISRKALLMANKVIRVITPDLKGMAWYSSNKATERTPGIDLFNVVNITEKNLFLPTSDVCAKIDSVAAVLPYSHAVKQQMLDGRLYDKLNDRTYTKKIQLLAKAVL